MDNGILGCIVGFFLGTFGTKDKLIEIGRKNWERQMLKSNYVPPYSGHWVNRGGWYDEDWYFREPEYKSRYVNVVEENESYIITIDWHKKSNAIDYCICKDQLDAETEMECFRIDYSCLKEIICKENDEQCYIYTIDTKDEIIIKISNQKDEELYAARRLHNDKTDFRVLDLITCLDESEAQELLYDMRYYYEEYKTVNIESYLASSRLLDYYLNS